MKKIFLLLAFIITSFSYSQGTISAPDKTTPLENSTKVVLNESRKTYSTRLDSIRNYFKIYFDTIYGSGGGASQLTDLSDVSSATQTNRFALISNGTSYIGRFLTEADISNLSHTTTLPIGSITGFTDNSSNWNTAFGWGNHAGAGYLTSTDISNFETTSELNTRDTNNRNRANHTGTQALSTLSQSGATTEQVAKWNGSAWIASTLNNANIVNGAGYITTTTTDGLYLSKTTPTLGGNFTLNNFNIIGNGNLNFTGNLTSIGSQFLNQGNLNLIHNTNATVAPEISFLGFRQGWRFGIDVANNGGSGDYVLLASDTFGGGVTDLIYMNRNKEGDNSISDNSGFPSLGFFLTPAFTDVQTMFATHESKPNRTTLGIRKAAATTDNFMLGFFGTEDATVDYGVKYNFEHSPFLKVRGDMEVLSDDINDTSVLRLNANPSDSSQDITMKAYYSGGTGYEFQMFSGNGSNNFYKYNIGNDISTFDHRLNSITQIAAGTGASNTQVLLGGLAGSGFASIHLGFNADAPTFDNYFALWDSGSGGTIFNTPTSYNMSFREGNTSWFSYNGTTNTSSLSVPLTSTSSVSATTFNGVALTTGGDDKKFLNELGTYTTAPSAAVTVNVQALTSSPADATTIYFGNMPKAPTTTANISKIYFRQSGTINVAEIYNYSGTAGTNEAWSLYIRKNNTTDYLIATVSTSTNERVFSNTSLSIPIVAGDYIEMKAVNPTWVTNPLTSIFGGYFILN